MSSTRTVRRPAVVRRRREQVPPPGRRRVAALGTAAAVGLTGALTGVGPGAAPAQASPSRTVPPVAAPSGHAARSAAPTPKVPVMTGTGGAVASVDLDASRVGLQVLRDGGNAADAAVAMGAALGVTEPYSAGIGGGGFLVYFDARSGRVRTVDGRETAPRSFTPTVFQAPDGTALPFAKVVSSGLSVGVPGTPALWDVAARRFGTRPLRDLLAPAERLARNGFTVDATFAQQTADNAARFAAFPETARVYLPGGAPPAVGSTFTNPDLAHAYRVLRRDGVDALYRGDLGRAVVDAARSPRTAPGVDVFAGRITRADLRAYRAPLRRPTHVVYRGLDVYGMPVPSSGGAAVGETLNLLEAQDRITGTPLRSVDDAQYLHRFSEATATAFADRNRWLGDVPRVPLQGLLSQRFADARACALFDPGTAAPRPLPFGDPRRDGRGGTDPATCRAASVAQQTARDDHGTTHLVAADRWGNVASYTLTIEQTGGSGITVPGYGFLLNNELTDFDFVPLTAGVPDPNLPGPGKRPRSSMAPTVVLRDGEPWLALGSPGGATIITTVAQVLTGYVDRGLPLVDAIATPRLSSRNGSSEQAEPAVADGPLGAALRTQGHVLSSTPEIGAASAVRLLPGGRFVAAAETSRRGGGSALVVRPDQG